jgi:hypothetical protein
MKQLRRKEKERREEQKWRRAVAAPSAGCKVTSRQVPQKGKGVYDISLLDQQVSSSRQKGTAAHTHTLAVK